MIKSLPETVQDSLYSFALDVFEAKDNKKQKKKIQYDFCRYCEGVSEALEISTTDLIIEVMQYINNTVKGLQNDQQR